jgi:hypothetical protein
MNCPHCQNVLPENYSASYCPKCGNQITPVVVVPDPAGSGPAPLTPFKVNWLLFWIVFLSPAILTCLTVFFGARTGETAPGVAMAGSVISAAICGALLGCYFGRTSEGRFGLGVMFTAVLGVAILGLSCFGCLALGYIVKFN